MRLAAVMRDFALVPPESNYKNIYANSGFDDRSMSNRYCVDEVTRQLKPQVLSKVYERDSFEGGSGHALGHGK